MSNIGDRTSVLKQATPEQYFQSLKNQLPEWGRSLTLEQFAERERIVGETRQGRCLQCWVLTPESDLETSDFYCSVETFRRPVLISPTTSEESVRRGITYSIASVFTPPHHRRKGHAQRMMTLLHDKLRRSSSHAEVSLKDATSSAWVGDGQDAELSFLYSDVGTFYARCAPPGWHIKGPTTVEYQISSLPSSFPSSNGPAFSAVTSNDFDRIAEADSKLLQAKLSRCEKPSFIVEPTGATYEWMTTRTIASFRLLGDLLCPETWGFEIGSSSEKEWSFVVFAIDTDPKTKAVNLLRTHCSSAEHYPILLSKIVEQVRTLWGSEGRVLGWNVEGGWIAEAEKAGLKGRVHERDEHLAAVAIYAEGHSEMEWLNNEQYSWC